MERVSCKQTAKAPRSNFGIPTAPLEDLSYLKSGMTNQIPYQEWNGSVGSADPVKVEATTLSGLLQEILTLNLQTESNIITALFSLTGNKLDESFLENPNSHYDAVRMIFEVAERNARLTEDLYALLR